MGLLNAQGLPVQLILQPDRNVADLTSQLAPGMTMRGRVTEVLGDGRAIVNFRGISVTAELRNVALTRGEVITVSVQDLGGTPVLRLMPPAAPVVSLQARAPTAVEAVLDRLGLPRDGFHAAVVQLLEVYGIPVTRESALAIKDLAVRLPALLAPGALAAEPNALPATGAGMSVSVPWSALIGRGTATAPGTSAAVMSWTSAAPNMTSLVPSSLTASPITLLWQAVSSPVPAAPVASGPTPLPSIPLAQSNGYVMGRLVASANLAAAAPGHAAGASLSPALGQMLSLMAETTARLAAQASPGTLAAGTTTGADSAIRDLASLAAAARNELAAAGTPARTLQVSAGLAARIGVVLTNLETAVAPAAPATTPQVPTTGPAATVSTTSPAPAPAATSVPGPTIPVASVAVSSAPVLPATAPVAAPAAPAPAAGTAAAPIPVPVVPMTELPTPVPATPALPRVMAAAELGGVLAGIVHETAVQSAASSASVNLPAAQAPAPAIPAQAATGLATSTPTWGAPVQAPAVSVAGVSVTIQAPAAAPTASGVPVSAGITTAPTLEIAVAPKASVVTGTVRAGIAIPGADATAPSFAAGRAPAGAAPTPATPAMPAAPGIRADVPRTMEAVAVAARSAVATAPSFAAGGASAGAPPTPVTASRVLAGDVIPAVATAASFAAGRAPAAEASAPPSFTAGRAPAAEAPTPPAVATARSSVGGSAPAVAAPMAPSVATGLARAVAAPTLPANAGMAAAEGASASQATAVPSPVPFGTFAVQLAARLQSTPMPSPSPVPQSAQPPASPLPQPAPAVSIPTAVATAPAVGTGLSSVAGQPPATAAPTAASSAAGPVPAVVAPTPPVAIGVDMIETATFMYSRGLPATTSSASASYEYLYTSPRLPQVLGQFETAAAAYLRDAAAAGPTPGAASQGLRVAVERLVSLARRMQVSPEGQGVHAQLKDAVEHLGLDHEARLARAVGQADDPARPAAADRRTAAAGLQRETAEAVRDTLKSAALEVQQRAREAEAGLPAGAPRAHLSALRDAASEIVQVVSAQQVGSWGGRDSVNIVQVQIPIAIGGEIRGGDIRVSWRREKDGKKRDPRVPARMTMEVETRSLGPVGVHMQMLGQALSLIFRVYEEGVRDFMNDEMPELVAKLTGYKFRLDQCMCEMDDPEPEPAPETMVAARVVPPTASLDIKA